MIKKIILLACLTTSCIFAKENQNTDLLNQMGRYQLVANDKELYLLEIDTGKIWVAERWQRKDIRVMYPNGWKQLKLEPPINGCESPDKITKTNY
jgi:hypothetical protein